MASAADISASTASAPPKSGRVGVGMLLGAVLLSTAGAGGAAYFVMGKSKGDPEHGADSAHGGGHGDDHAVPPAPAAYLPLEPAFVVNLEDPDEPRYLQAEIQLMSRDPVALEAVKVHVPRIRHSLLMLFGQQKPADLATRAGKEALQLATLAEIQKVMKEETGKPVVDAAYFTSFVMQ